jgi:hypothetical protein
MSLRGDDLVPRPILIDDPQWANEGTLLGLRKLSDSLSGLPAVFLLAIRNN